MENRPKEGPARIEGNKLLASINDLAATAPNHNSTDNRNQQKIASFKNNLSKFNDLAIDYKLSCLFKFDHLLHVTTANSAAAKHLSSLINEINKANEEVYKFADKYNRSEIDATFDRNKFSKELSNITFGLGESLEEQDKIFRIYDKSLKLTPEQRYQATKEASDLKATHKGKGKAGKRNQQVTITANTEPATTTINIAGEVLKDPNAAADKGTPAAQPIKVTPNVSYSLAETIIPLPSISLLI